MGLEDFVAGMKEEDEEEFDLCGQDCFEFNEKLDQEMDDGCCEHCSKFFTTRCQHLDEFMDEIDDYD